MLGDVLASEAFGFLLVSIRLSALVMVVPIFGDRSIPQRMRIAFSLSVSFIVYSVIRNDLPAMPPDIFSLVTLFIQELLIGLTLGLMMRFLMSAMHLAGTVISFQTGLAAARAFDPAQGQQSAVVAAFLNLIAITLILVTDLHHLMLRGMAHSFYKFPIGEDLMLADFAVTATQLLSSSFQLGFHIAAPFIVYGMVYNLGLGLLARMVPGFQVFFIGMPINILMGFTLFSLLLSSIMTLFLGKFEELLNFIIG
jgi:flagellar biosynthesis protein FliR